jgi:hypothetical protein
MPWVDSNGLLVGFWGLVEQTLAMKGQLFLLQQ